MAITQNRVEPELLRRLLRYEPETGLLYWLPRPVGMFTDERGNARAACARWNTRLAGKEAFASLSGNGYRQGVIFWGKHLGHRVAWAIYYGQWPIQIDHINGDRADNRISNLREVTATENCRNMARQRRNQSGVLGVRWTKGAWQAEITLNNRTKYLGRFQDKSAAIAVRLAAEREHGFHPNHGRRA